MTHEPKDKKPVDADSADQPEQSNADPSSAAAPAEPAGGDIQTQIADLKKQADEYLNSWKRAAADFQNYKKQQESERQNWIALSNATLILEILPALDDLDKALGTVTPDIRKTPWFEGIALIRKKMSDSLNKAGLEEIDAKGKKFDPKYHEAVLQEPSETTPSGNNIEVLQKGYMLQGRVIRAAMVKVAE